MSRSMPGLAQRFRESSDAACELALAGEQVRAIGGRSARDQITVPRLEYLYEIAFLRIFIAWEFFLEESFLRYLCGFQSAAGQIPRVGGAAPLRNLQTARSVLYGSNQYLLWHSATRVIARSQTHFVAGLHEKVISSNQARVEWFANVRHRVAHGQDDARRKFDAATMSLIGRRYPGSRAGRFLRDLDPSHVPATRWIRSIASELVALADQVTPP